MPRRGFRKPPAEPAVVDYGGDIDDSVRQMVCLFESLGADMHFTGEISEKKIDEIDVDSVLSLQEKYELIGECMR